MDWREIPSLSALRAFEATARLLSFSKAAGELNVTHAAIAQHVRGLEAEFSESLVVRAGRGIALTHAGERLAARLVAGFGEIASGVKDIRQMGVDRPLTISVTPAFATSWLMPRIGSFWSAHPDITLNISPTYNLVDLAKDNVDMAIRFGDGNWAGCDVEYLTNGDLVVVGHPDLINNPNANSMKDLTGLTWFFEKIYARERRLVVSCEGFDLDTAEVNTLASSDLVFAAVNAKLGISAITRTLIEPKINTGELQAVCVLKSEGLGYHLVTRKNFDSPSLRIFRKWLRQEAKET
ncbi:MAG: LysR family transcriptional regulator [Amylibacter sp.]|jgi:LysR family transcriptional regulator, glycine cleavage system transcriptional activator|nr:LysR family transcriptional regulator [Amylibacter sp.]